MESGRREVSGCIGGGVGGLGGQHPGMLRERVCSMLDRRVIENFVFLLLARGAATSN